MKGAYLKALSVLGLVHCGCTFYTGCPDNPAPNQPGTGNNGGTGGTGTGNVGGLGGTSITSQGGDGPTGEWVNETFNLADRTSQCGNVSLLSAKPGVDDVLIVGVANLGLFSKSSDADEWVSLGRGKGSADIRNIPRSIVYDPDDPNVFWESGIYNLGGVYRTDDGGSRFEELPTTHNDGVAIDFSDPFRQTLLVTGHEQAQALSKSTDGGQTWTPIGMKFPGGAGVCNFPFIVDTNTYLLGCGSYGGGTGGIFRSTNGGDSWERVSDLVTATAPRRADDGTLYWAGETGGGLMRSGNQGATWDGPFGSGDLAGVTPAELPDGRLATIGANRVVVSEDQGETWHTVSAPLPVVGDGIVYAPVRKAFYISHGTCDIKVPEDAVMAYDFDWEAE